MSRDRAAYMREYRRQKRGRPSILDVDAGSADWTIARAATRILELEGEITHLKRELANRPAARIQEFRPVPKPVRKAK